MLDKKTLSLLSGISDEVKSLADGFATMLKVNDELNRFNSGVGRLFNKMAVNAYCHEFSFSKAAPVAEARRPEVRISAEQKKRAAKQVMKPPAPVTKRTVVRKTGRPSAAERRARSKSRDRKSSMLVTALKYLRSRLPPKYNNDFEKKRLNTMMKGMRGKDWMGLSSVVKGGGFSVFQTKEFLQTLQKVGVIEKKKMKIGFSYRLKAIQSGRKSAR